MVYYLIKVAESGHRVFVDTRGVWAIGASKGVLGGVIAPPAINLAPPDQKHQKWKTHIKKSFLCLSKVFFIWRF